MNEKDVKKYIFRLQKNGREKLLHCIMISRKDPMKALQEAEKEAVNKGIILESYTDIPVEILKSCGIVPMDDSFEEVVVGDYPNGSLFEKYGFAVACCEYCRNFCEGICTYHCEEEAADNVCNYLQNDNIVELYYDGDEERNLIGSYYIDSDKIKTPLDLLDAFNKSGRTPEMVTELLNDALTDCSRFTFD